MCGGEGRRRVGKRSQSEWDWNGGVEMGRNVKVIVAVWKKTVDKKNVTV
jgi:hypothetical protein